MICIKKKINLKIETLFQDKFYETNLFKNINLINLFKKINENKIIVNSSNMQIKKLNLKKLILLKIKNYIFLKKFLRLQKSLKKRIKKIDIDIYKIQ